MDALIHGVISEAIDLIVFRHKHGVHDAALHLFDFLSAVFVFFQPHKFRWLAVFSDWIQISAEKKRAVLG